VWSGSGKHGHLGSLKAVVELCVFGPSLFGYRIISHSSSNVSQLLSNLISVVDKRWVLNVLDIFKLPIIIDDNGVLK
jgi:hypothetical protein